MNPHTRPPGWVWNGMIDRYPSLIVRPADPAGVAAAVRLAHNKEMRGISGRSGILGRITRQAQSF